MALFFRFQELLEDFKTDSSKKEVIEKYEKLVEPLDGKSIEDTVFFRNYLSRFKLPSIYPWYQVPEGIKDDFDWNLLARLVIGSLSSEVKLVFPHPELQELPRFGIEVEFSGTGVKRYIDELFIFQVHRLFYIYIDELMQFEILRREDLYEMLIIDEKRQKRIDLWNKERFPMLEDYFVFLSLYK